ncbi:MAG: glycosyltransferase family 2 protein [Phycisphaerae bacterium]|nr:glycosyltransferase family 2 protein [Phycisphaerae bacterium]
MPDATTTTPSARPEPRHPDADRLALEHDSRRQPPGHWPAIGSVPVSVLVPVKNEEANIVECLRHMLWASELTIIDSQSKDKTIPLAQAMGADVYQFYLSKEGWPKKRNWALASVPWKHEWVLIIDADEHVTPALAEEIRQVVTGTYRPDPKRAGSGDAYWMNRRLIFMGRWVKGGGYYPSWNIRLFKHRVGRYERIGAAGDTQSGDNEVHEHVVLSTGQAGYLREDFLHYAYPDLYSWVEKHNRYTSWEAHTMESGGGGQVQGRLFGTPIERRRWIKSFTRKLPFRPTMRFIYGYIVKRGFLDGYPGYVICRLMAWYEFMSIAKYRELKYRERQRKEA